MAIVVVGLNHKSAPVELRERLAFSTDALATALPALCARDGVDEAVIVSTCNRVEVYLSGDAVVAPAAVRAFFVDEKGVDASALDAHVVDRADVDALAHLFRVAAALDSVVVGEPQILGQVKDGFFAAVNAGTVGPALTRAFHRAFTTAKRVRTETQIAAAAQNVASAGVDLAAQIFGDLSGLSCVLVGAGDMGELAARHFARAGARLTVTNRSLERAQRLAHEHGGVARELAELPQLLVDADVVLVATGATGFVVDKDAVARAHKARRYRALLLVDISVPRNVDPACAQLDNTYLYDVDDLASVVDDNLAKRKREALKAEEIVSAELLRAEKQAAEARALPVIKAVRERAAQLAAAEAQKTLAALGPTATDKQKKSVEAMAQAIVNKLLHEPLTRLKAAAADDNAAVIAAAADLFGVDADPVSVDDVKRAAADAAGDDKEAA
jgi:glutamyl-tRNA reductase